MSYFAERTGREAPFYFQSAQAQRSTVMAKKKESKATGLIELERLTDSIVDIPIIGLTPFIPHKWSEKAKRQMPGHPDADKISKAKGKRNPKEEADACLYRLGNSFAFPAVGFKAAIVSAARYFDNITLVEAKILIRVLGEGSEQLVRLKGKKELHEDLPRNASGNPDLRYRYYICDWSGVLRVEFPPMRISQDSIISMVDAGGRSGIGDWRPNAPKSMTGTFGTWRVDQTKEIKIIV